MEKLCLVEKLSETLRTSENKHDHLVGFRERNKFETYRSQKQNVLVYSHTKETIFFPGMTASI